MTINYTPTPGVAGLGNFAVSITDPTGVPYPDGTTASITSVASTSTTITFTCSASVVGVFAVGQTVAISGTTGTGSTTYNGSYYSIASVSGSTFTVASTLNPGSAANGLATLSYAPQTRTFPVDTSFEPYRREAFRHRSIPAQREAIQLTNIMGEGTINTEGLWRREMREFQDGAGQQYLDHKEGDVSSRFYSSKGVDVFSYPYQATLLPDTYQVATISSNSVRTVSCAGYMVTAYSHNPVTVLYFNPATSLGSSWGSGTSMTFNTSTYGGTAPTTLYDMTAANSTVYLATDTGIWFGEPGASGAAGQFQFFAGLDPNSSFTGYNMVAWANDQLIAASNNRLYAFQPRTATSAPVFGSGPSSASVTTPIRNVKSVNYSTSPWLYTITVETHKSHNAIIGQQITLANTFINNLSVASSYISVDSNGDVTCTAIAAGQSFGLSAGDVVEIVYHNLGPAVVKKEQVRILSVSNPSFGGSPTPGTITFSSRVVNSSTSINYLTITGQSNSTFDGTYNVHSVVDAQTYTILAAPPIGGFAATGSTGNPPASGGTSTTSILPDLLLAHSDNHWVWSDAIGGETQVYLAGYSSRNGTKGNGCIYRSDLLGSSTTSPTDTTTVSTATVAQPFQLVSPVQALPMSPDEYPTCLQSYLNYIFIGTNRGIRMAQTLSIYDPSATATGDLKSGPLIPNILQPLNYPVTSIIGDGRFVWFAWNNYDLTSTGLGKLDLTTFINGDPLAPVYASDLMVTGQGIINSLSWNPALNIPVITVAGLGVYQPYAVNNNGLMAATKYVVSGSLTSSIFDYGIPDQKAPVYFEYGGVTPGSGINQSQLSANVICEPQESFAQNISISPFVSPSVIGTATKEYSIGSNPKSSQFQVVVTLDAGTIHSSWDATPIMYRWTLKAFPNVVSGTNISAVLQLFSVAVVDGREVYMDPYDNFYWLESLRQAQNLVTYTEGPLSASIAIIESTDWIPHKRRDNYENGYEGDCVVTIKTLGPYSYTPQTTI